LSRGPTPASIHPPFNIVPTPAFRNGDFSAALVGRVLGADPLGRPIAQNAIYDPNTQRVVNGQIIRDAFPGNIISPARIDPVALKVQALVPSNPFSSRAFGVPGMTFSGGVPFTAVQIAWPSFSAGYISDPECARAGGALNPDTGSAPLNIH
jgi:hypothetical protein